jgi:hypothetical protein
VWHVLVESARRHVMHIAELGGDGCENAPSGIGGNVKRYGDSTYGSGSRSISERPGVSFLRLKECLFGVPSEEVSKMAGNSI